MHDCSFVDNTGQIIGSFEVLKFPVFVFYDKSDNINSIREFFGMEMMIFMYVRGLFAGSILIFLGSLIGIALVVVIWVLVARDAKEHDISPSVLWGAIAALVPGFIGLVGYMVVRYISKWNKNNGQQG